MVKYLIWSHAVISFARVYPGKTRFQTFYVYSTCDKREFDYPTSSEVFGTNGPPFTLVFVIFSASWQREES